MEILSNYLHDALLRRSFNALAGKTFGLDFEPWYRQGWSGKYFPYSVSVGGQIVSNVSLNRIDALLDGNPRHYVQLGTVMTNPDYRGRGYCRQLMERVLDDCRGCDGVFLYANDSVLDFYPKFGFRPHEEYRYRAPLAGAQAVSVRPHPMASPEDWRPIPLDQFRGVLRPDTDGLLMFYLTGPMRECVYHHPASDAYIVAELSDGLLTVYGVFASRDADILELCRAFGPQVRRVEFAFTPEDPSALEEFLYKEEDTTLFLLGESLERDMSVLRGFPELLHT